MMEAKVPLIIVQFQQDYFCNPPEVLQLVRPDHRGCFSSQSRAKLLLSEPAGRPRLRREAGNALAVGRLRPRAARRVAKFLDSCDRRLSMPCRWLLQLPIAWTDGISATDARAVPDMLPTCGNQSEGRHPIHQHATSMRHACHVC